MTDIKEKLAGLGLLPQQGNLKLHAITKRPAAQTAGALLAFDARPKPPVLSIPCALGSKFWHEFAVSGMFEMATFTRKRIRYMIPIG